MAAAAVDRDRWALGDALLDECGPPSEDGVRDGGHDRLETAARVLAAAGYEYSTDYLRSLRRTAYAFPASARSFGHPFSISLRAGAPDRLQAIVKMAGDRPLIVKLLDEIRAQLTPPRGSGSRLQGRARLEHEFLQAFVDDFAKYGKPTIMRVRELDPLGYLKLARSLLPVESKVDVKVGDFSDAHSIEEIFAQVAADLGEAAAIELQRTLDRLDGKEIDGEVVEEAEQR